MLFSHDFLLAYPNFQDVQKKDSIVIDRKKKFNKNGNTCGFLSSLQKHLLIILEKKKLRVYHSVSRVTCNSHTFFIWL